MENVHVIKILKGNVYSTFYCLFILFYFLCNYVLVVCIFVYLLFLFCLLKDFVTLFREVLYKSNSIL